MASSPSADQPGSPIGLTGPTGIGKSAVALALADRVPVEIISVDSTQVYRGMDIGSAKPNAGERAAVAHHLIDIRDPGEPYSAAEFARDARQLIPAIQQRGRIPLLVGGTMLYFKALLEGLDALPAADERMRDEIERDAATLGWPALHARLARVDPATAARLAPTDSQRIQRALEVWRVSGQPLSALQTRTALDAGSGWLSQPRLFCLKPARRGWLHERIAARFDAMLQAGLVQEVERLRARGDLSPALPALRSVGYRQVWETLDGEQPEQTLRARGIAATRQLAKRQLTWLRSADPGRTLLVDDTTSPPQLAASILQRLAAQDAPAAAVVKKRGPP